jgi:2-polyprenyl-3-methyl-5-hydroxy-6-metoxy-1,4-benzoquinol methylase
MKLLTHINRDYITNEWNKFSNYRFKQIISGIDISYKNTIEPAMINEFKLLKKIPRLLDVGCGSGVLTKYYATIAEYVMGIDPSIENIMIAKEYCKENKNIHFENYYAEDYFSENKFDCIVSNMVLMDVLNVFDVLKSISKNLIEGGIFIFTIIHPCFFPIYYKYNTEKWFNYNSELIIENNFTITNEISSYKTVHIHRPLHLYLNLLNDNDLTIIKSDELFGENFNFPRFLLIKCMKK